MRFWRNPEFVRYVRAELRPTRAFSAAALALVICALVGLSAWSGDRYQPHEFFKDFYYWLMGIQFAVLIFWCASGCGHAISREREMKTYDFLRTTRLTSGELIVGKTLGVPAQAYFTVGCTIPVSVLIGILAGFPILTLFWTYLLLLMTALFVSVLSLWGSMQLEGAGARSVGLLTILPVALGFSMAESPFPGFGAISIFPALFSLYGTNTYVARQAPTLFGTPVPFVLLTVILFAMFGAWFVLMLHRNIKKDIEQVRLLSRWQATGLAAFLNTLFYAFLDPHKVSTVPGVFGTIPPSAVSSIAVVLNAVILLVIGVAMLAPQEKLKVWWRKYAAGEESYLSESGPPWPWLIPPAVIAYALLAMEALGLRGSIPLSGWNVGTTALQLLVFLVFTIRDILFLQWTVLTRMKRPVVKGFLYLWLYYAAAGIVTSVFTVVSNAQGRFLLGVLTPYGIFAAEGIRPSESPGVYVGVSSQILIVWLLLRVVSVRLRRPAIVPALSTG